MIPRKKVAGIIVDRVGYEGRGGEDRRRMRGEVPKAQIERCKPRKST